MSSNKEITDILKEAAEAVAAADLPKELQHVAFGKVVDLLAGTNKVGLASKKPEPGPTSGRLKPSSDPDDPLQLMADKLKVEVDVIGEIFEAEDGNVKLTIAPSKLEASKSSGTKQIAVLLAAARQAAGIEEWTETKTIREVANDYGKVDSPNFAASIGELGDYFSFSGTGKSRSLKMRKAGFEHAADMIKSLHSPV